MEIKMKNCKKIIATSLLLTILNPVYADDKVVPYPDGYRQWNHVKSMIIQPGHPLAKTDEGMHHIYANEGALEGLKSGVYPNGSVLVYDLLAYIVKDKTMQEGERKLVGVMHKDSEAFAETGGWGFEGFAGNSKTGRLIKDGGTACFSCHAPHKDKGYVFSNLRD